MSAPHTDLATTAQAMASVADTYLRDMARQDAEREAWFARMAARRRASQEAMWASEVDRDLPEAGLEA